MSKACEVTLPDLISVQGLVKKLQLSNNANANIFTGSNLSRSIGRGMEYAESRVYQPGDDARHIDWRITAKHNKPYTKLYHEEKGEENQIILDLSSSMYFGTGSNIKSVTASLAAALLAWIGFNQNNNIGGLVFNNQKLDAFKSSNTKRKLLVFLNTIVNNHDVDLVKQTDNKYNLDKAINSNNHLFKKNSRIYIVSDFLNIDENFCKTVEKLNYTNLVVLVRIADKIESIDLTPGDYPISNGTENFNIAISEKNKEIFKNFFNKKLQKYFHLINQKGIKNITIYPETNWYYTIKTAL